MQRSWVRRLSGLVLVLSFSAAASVFQALPVSAQRSASSQQVRSYNDQLLQVYARLASSPAGQATTAIALRSQAGAILQARAAALESLIQEDPSQALSLAFDPNALADLAAAFP